MQQHPVDRALVARRREDGAADLLERGIADDARRLALAEIGWTRVQPKRSAASKVAPSAERVPRNAAGISLARWKSRRRHSAMSVRMRLNVLVSCMNRPVRTRATLCPRMLPPPLRGGSGGEARGRGADRPARQRPGSAGKLGLTAGVCS